MIKKYFNQAWQLIKQDKLYSSIYIIGTGLAISMVMVIAIVYYAKIADLYPETRRSRTMIVNKCIEKTKGARWSSSAYLSRKFVEEILRPMKNAERLSAVIADGPACFIEKEGTEEYIPVRTKFTDEEFWKIFTFKFLWGGPFTRADVYSGVRKAVVSSSMAKEIFGTGEAVGKTFRMNFDEYKVCGVVGDVSYLTTDAYARVWVPVSCSALYRDEYFESGMAGELQVYLLAESRARFNAVKEELRDRVERYNTNLKDIYLDIKNQPLSYKESLIPEFQYAPDQGRMVIAKCILVLLGLLLVPALNLAGMVSSRMERRYAEIGIRKAFGAPGKMLLRQILYENLLFTFLGGLTGLLLSYVYVAVAARWLPLLLNQDFVYIPGSVDVFLTPGMLFSPFIFLISFLICLILNVLSAYLPAVRSLRRNIAESLNMNR